MIKTILKILLIFGLVVLQVTLIPFLKVSEVWPNLILLVTLVLVLDDFLIDALFFAILGGLFLDLASSSFFGLNVLILVFLVILIKFVISRYLTEPNLWIITLILGLSSVFYSLIFILIYHNVSYLSLLWSFIYNSLAGILIYWFLGYFLKTTQEIKIN